MNIKVRKWKFIQKVQNIHVFILLSIDFDVLLFFCNRKKKGFLQTIFFILPAVIFSYSHMSVLFCLSVSYYFYVYIHIYFLLKSVCFLHFQTSSVYAPLEQTLPMCTYLSYIQTGSSFFIFFFAVVIIHDER